MAIKCTMAPHGVPRESNIVSFGCYIFRFILGTSSSVAILRRESLSKPFEAGVIQPGIRRGIQKLTLINVNAHLLWTKNMAIRYLKFEKGDLKWKVF